jgi:hypothetical protein
LATSYETTQRLPITPEDSNCNTYKKRIHSTFYSLFLKVISYSSCKTIKPKYFDLIFTHALHFGENQVSQQEYNTVQSGLKSQFVRYANVIKASKINGKFK